MRHDIQANERAFTSKEAAEEVGIATPTVRKYSQILERNGYEFFKEGDRRIFVQSDIEALQTIRDTDKPLTEIAETLVRQQKERLEDSDEPGISVPDTYESVPADPGQMKEFLMVLANELEISREMNVRLTHDMSQLKTTVSQLQQDHHAISSGIGNAAQRTNAKIEKLTEQQKSHYETLLLQEKKKSDFLQKEIQNLREEQKKEWRSQNDFNKRLEEVVQKPKGNWEWFFSMFRK